MDFVDVGGIEDLVQIGPLQDLKHDIVYVIGLELQLPSAVLFKLIEDVVANCFAPLGLIGDVTPLFFKVFIPGQGPLLDSC